MTTQQKKQADHILADAANSQVPRDDVLHRLTVLSHDLNGDERFDLGRQVHHLLDNRGA
jgi:hypothetical protein